MGLINPSWKIVRLDNPDGSKITITVKEIPGRLLFFRKPTYRRFTLISGARLWLEKFDDADNSVAPSCIQKLLNEYIGDYARQAY